MQYQYTYTGHETFACRSYWLKKGVDFIKKGHSFNDIDACSRLGVGKNMVRSIRFWLRSFQLTDNDLLGEFSELIFSDEGWDPYLEDINTIWLMHYVLIKNGYAKIYSDLFNDFKKNQSEFRIENFERFLNDQELTIAENTIKSDILVLKNNYIRSTRKIISIEDSSSVFLQELNLIEELSNGYYQFNNRSKTSLSNSIVKFAILDNFNGEPSISFESLLNGKNSPGNVFCLNESEMYQRIIEIVESDSRLVFSENAGIRELQINKECFENKNDILLNYYDPK